MAKQKMTHPHDALIHKLEDCLEELIALNNDYEIDEDEYLDAYNSLDSAIDDTRQMNIS